MYVRLGFVLMFLMHTTRGTETKNNPNLELEDELRTKRQINSLPLVYPYGGTYRLILSISAPIKNDDHVNLAFGASFLYQYTQFTNITQLSQYYPVRIVSREQRDTDWDARKDERLIFFMAVEQMLNAKGFDGRACLLRAICEAAAYSLAHDGLVGEIAHILLTPNYGRSLEDLGPEWAAQMSAYMDAYTAGRQLFSCSYIYGSCPEGEGLLDIISVLRDPD